MAKYIPFILLLFFCNPVSAEIVIDTTSIITKNEIIKQKQQQSPTGALLRSLIIPGWGQYYNHSYIKAVIVAGTETYLLSRAIKYWRKAEDQYDLVQVLDESSSSRNDEFNSYLEYRNRRNDFLWYSGITLFISIFDAFVDAHLSGFDVDLTPEFDEEDNLSGINIKYSF